MELQLSQNEIDEFLKSKFWLCMKNEFENWIEQIRSLLEHPNGMEGYSIDSEPVLSAKLRGNLETLRNVMLPRVYLSNYLPKSNKGE